MQSEPLVSLAVPDDIPGLLEIERASFSDPWTEAMMRAQVEGEGRLMTLARVGMAVAGYAGLMYVLDEGYISNIAVLPEFRRRGIASALIGDMLGRAKELGLSFLTLEVRESNAPARALYSASGFSDVGIRRGYYENPRGNAVLMTRFIK